MSASDLDTRRPGSEIDALERENSALRRRLAEAQNVLQAIHRGEIDALVVGSPEGDRVFTLEGADHPYRLLVEAMHEGAATLTPDGLVVYSNRRLASLLGASAEALAGSTLADWVAPAQRARLAEWLRASEHAATGGELTLLPDSADPLPVLGSFSSLVIAEQRFVCAVLTDLRLAKHHEALERAEQQTREANARLLRADQRKDEFLATLAHELRNPLAPIGAAAQIVKLMEHEDPRLAFARSMIERQVAHMSRLVSDLLEISRITLGTLDLERRPASLQNLLASAVEAIEATTTEHRFRVTLPETPLPIEADAVRLSQALSNVLQNAVKYTPAGGTIRVSAARESGQAVVRIADDGAGIAAEMLPRIFDMFVQGEASANRSRSGLGIGLALARRLVEMHGGTIEAASEGLGRGSCFTLRLPLASESIAAAAPSGEAKPRETDGRSGHPRRVLVVDDNVDAAESLRTVLELSGHTARAAFSGDAALAAFEELAPHVVVLDIGLPDFDGYELARRIRAGKSASGLRPTLIALSGWGQPEHKQRASAAGIDAYFTKPIRPSVLARYIADGPSRPDDPSPLRPSSAATAP